MNDTYEVTRSDELTRSTRMMSNEKEPAMNTQNLEKARKLALGAVIANVVLLLGAAVALPEPARTVLPLLALMLPFVSATVVEAASGLSDEAVHA